jgi:hypothetical protein
MRFVFFALCHFALPASLLGAEGLDFPVPAKEERASLGAASLVARFPFVNRSSQALTFARFESDCSCMTIETTEKKMRFGPGESGEIIATFQIGNYLGTVEKTLRIWLEGAGAQPSQILKLKAVVPEVVTIEPKTLQWPVGSKEETKAARITLQGDKPVRILQVTSSDANFSPTVKEVEPGRVYEVAVLPTSTAQKALGVIKIQTDSAIQTQRSAQFFSVVK